MKAMRNWAVRHSGMLEHVYTAFSRLLVFLNPLLERLDYDRIERPAAAVEATLKGFMFDCHMCGQCVLSSTGMSCPMNCPKELRNGPCGGVRADGHCEVKPEMRCVWVAAWEGSRQMQKGDRILELKPPVNRTWSGRSSWLAVAKGKHPS